MRQIPDYILALFIVMLTSHSAAAQQLPEIDTDRPDQTESPSTVPKKYFQLEVGFEYDREVKESYSFLLPTTLFKYGLSKRTELRLITEIEKERSVDGINTGLTPIALGFKTNLVKEKGALPEISLLGHLSFPHFAARHKQNTFYAPEFRFTLANTLSSKVDIGYNLGAEWNGSSRHPTYIYTFTTGITLTEKVSSFLEIYGFISGDSSADHRIDTGFGYLLNNNVKLDIAGGAGISPGSPFLFPDLRHLLQVQINSLS